MSPPRDDRKLCFVVMGFGKKTDFESGRTFDLDATYEHIIEPAATGLGLRCIRADEVLHSGVIDRPMFEMLYRADLVVADISTGNVNAVYELGVRHALRPNSTIIMKENEGRLHFDLNHINTFQYEHLGADIGAREAARARRDLGLLIEQVLASKDPDSPVYTFLPNLQGPRVTDEEFAEIVDEAEAAQKRLAGYIRTGQRALKASRAAEAAHAFGEAAKIKPDEPYLLQQLALATYKAEQPSKLESLLRAWTILASLDPDDSNDPETLGLAGAIRKRLHDATNDFEQLNLAIRYYGRGFE
ncbi:MAG TPA: tetratricopeptide repeat-containing protein, partial [Sphingomicrobium sp.]